MLSEVIELSGHIIDSWSLPRAWDTIMDRGGNFNVEEMRVGVSKTEPSYARLKVEAPDQQILELIISELQQLGAVLLHGNDVQTATVEQHGVLPTKFYSTTNLPTQVRLNGQWVNVENIEMDVAIVIDSVHQRAYGKPMHDVQIGEQVVIGHEAEAKPDREEQAERSVAVDLRPGPAARRGESGRDARPALPDPGRPRGRHGGGIADRRGCGPLDGRGRRGLFPPSQEPRADREASRPRREFRLPRARAPPAGTRTRRRSPRTFGPWWGFDIFG